MGSISQFGAVILAGVVSLTGCGTVNTVFSDDQVVKRKLNNAETYCNFIPRTYSGVAYDFCYLHSRPSHSAAPDMPASIPSTIPPPQTDNTLPWLIADMGLSGILDTAVLPYTIYLQSTDGSLDLN